MKNALIIFILLMLCTGLGLYANDTEMGNFGFNMIPLRDSKVQMVREIVYVKMTDESSFNVRCKFWFYNHGKTVQLRVGFPDFYPDNSSYENYQPFQNFKSMVNGKTVTLDYTTVPGLDTILAKFKKPKKESTNWNEAVEGEITVRDTLNTNTANFDEDNTETNNEDFLPKKWYIKTVDFPANDTVVVENYYEGHLGGTVAHPFAYLAFFKYYIGSGSSWYDKIEDGLVVFDYTDLRSSDFIRNPQSLSINKNIKATISENLATFSYRDYKPPINETLGIEFYLGFHFYQDDPSDFEKELNAVREYDETDYWAEIRNTFSEKKINRISKELTAREGYKFKDKADNDYFKQKSWYKPKSKVESDRLENAMDAGKGLIFLKKYCPQNTKFDKINKINEDEIYKLKKEFKIK